MYIPKYIHKHIHEPIWQFQHLWNIFVQIGSLPQVGVNGENKKNETTTVNFHPPTRPTPPKRLQDTKNRLGEAEGRKQVQSGPFLPISFV